MNAALPSFPVEAALTPGPAFIKNSPEIVMRVRSSLGLEIPCSRRSLVDRDGRTVHVGAYALIHHERELVAAILARGD